MATIGKYQVVEQIGEGAMGVVYKALDPVLNRTVAIKVMSEGLAQDEVLRERFLREAQAAGSLQHPNLVTIYDFGETDGHLFIAMEFIEGADLESLMAKGAPLNLPTKLDLMIDVLNGLSFAHRRGIVHRDIKPANIRIDQEGRARIMDFGVAKMSTSNLTGTGVMMGTPNYMAPEQITGEKTLGPAADLWAVGAVLYELLTNQRPFEADTLHRVLFRIVSDNPANVTQSMPGLPPALDEVVSKALAKDPENRYKSAAEMANAIAAVRSKVGAPRLSRTVSQRSSIEAELLALREKGGQSMASGVGATFVPVAAPPAPAAAPAPAAIPTPGGVPAVSQPSRSNWVLIGAGALVLLIAVGSVAYLGSRAGRAGQVSEQVVARPAAEGQPTPSLPAPTPSAVQASQPQENAPVTPTSPATSPARDRAPASRTTGAAQRAESRLGAVEGQRDTAGPPAQVQSAPTPQTQSAAATSQTPTQTQSQAQSPPPSSPPQQQVAAPTPNVAAPPPAAAQPAVVENPRPAIEAVLGDYARAIGTRQLAEMKRVYAGMTAQQQAGWEGLFSSTRSIKATLDISSLSVGNGTATARVTGNYEFVTRVGRTERQPASFEATFARQGEAWMLQRIR